MGNDVSKGFTAVGNTLRDGLGAWFDPAKRGVILGQVSKALPTLHQDLQRVSAEHSPALGLVSQVASGLLKTLPVGQLAENVLKNASEGNVGGLIGNAIEAKTAKPGTYTGAGLTKLDLAKGIGREITEANKPRPEPTPDVVRTVAPAPTTIQSKPASTIKSKSKSRADQLRELAR